MKTPSLSVIVAVRNVEKYLPKMLSSIDGQRKFLHELIFIEDGSADRTAVILEQFIRNRNNVHLLKINPTGVSFARNWGLQKATGDFVLFLDGDDLFNEFFFEKMLNAVKEDTDVVVCRSRELDDVTGLSCSQHWAVRKDNYPNNGNQVFYKYLGWAWDKIFRREFLLKNGIQFPNLQNSEDLVFVYKALLLTNKVEVIDDELIYHRVSNSLSLSNLRSKHVSDAYNAVKQLHDFLISNQKISEKNSVCFQEWAADFILWAYKIEKSSLEELKKSFPIIQWNELTYKKKLYFKPLDLKLNYILSSLPSPIRKFYFLLFFLKKYGVKRFLIRTLSETLKTILKLKGKFL